MTDNCETVSPADTMTVDTVSLKVPQLIPEEQAMGWVEHYLGDIGTWYANQAPQYYQDGKFQCPDCLGQLELICPSQFRCTGKCPQKKQVKNFGHLLSSLNKTEFPYPKKALYYLAAQQLRSCIVEQPNDTRHAELIKWVAFYVQAMKWRVVPVYEIGLNGFCTCSKGPDCKSPGKHPRVGKWEQRATNDLTQALAWWNGNWRHSNIGLATGPESNVYVIDLDGPTGIANFQKLIEPLGDTPDVPCQITGSRAGRQYFFEWPADGTTIRGNASIIDEGIDIRGMNGLAILPPSNHRSGEYYEWILG
ncbi:bifunctional DNA primase/polymerase [Desulfomonile tiedjei]|uniref:Bifunctional DNA primase/polymerase famiily protein n=1 Tax=Desulfomonile tiedjei (strain ATCC 49306 / DSM 6799 / DCB-1) TaxID=706587 RepID=I4C8Y3_DESTA|nr:bifunctional DNA primase/polymerase [Desulfomonile tiedjei]AFM26024.1 bifunctional DNA primase/polymerase famiily protein [Desulfomonile tiedjei DSM 6799]